MGLWKGCDSNGDGQFSHEEIAQHWKVITARGFSLEGVAAVLGAGEIVQGPAQLTIPLRFDLPRGPRVTMIYGLYLQNVANQQSLAVFNNKLGVSSTLLLNEKTVSQSLDFGNQIESQEQRPSTLAGFLSLGIKHTLTGYDHLLFLLTLVIVGGDIWRWLKVITAFSVAHSISLALAVFGVVHLSPEIIEPIIAISITISAIFSFRGVPTQTLHGGWILAFSFGLIHGLGFAGVLAEMQLSGRQALVPLVGFNLGVEAGQLGVAALMLPIVRWLCRDQRGAKIRQALTVLAGLMGMYWFVTRI